MRMITIALLTCAVAAARAADATPPDPAKMQAMMEQMSKTGAEHAALAKAVGDWDVQSSMWMGPGAPPMQSKGKATFSMILDGKWLRQDFTGDMMGKPFTGLGLSGYDTVAKQYVGAWTDSMGTMLTTMKGESSDGGKTITYKSHMEQCPMTGGPIDTRYVMARESDDKMTFTAFDTVPGQPETKSMELVYTRAKK